MSRLPTQPAFNPDMERPANYNGQGQIKVNGPVPKQTAKVGLPPLDESSHFNVSGVRQIPAPQPVGLPARPAFDQGRFDAHKMSAADAAMPTGGPNTPFAGNAFAPEPAPKVTAPRAATATPNAPAGDGKGSNPIVKPTPGMAAPPGFGMFQGVPEKAVGALNGFSRNAFTATINSPLNLSTWGSPGGGSQAPAPAKPAAQPALPPSADALNAQYDAAGYGPHSAPAQPRNAGIGVQGPAAVQPQAAWQTSAKAAQPGSPEWRQQFWRYDSQTGQHTFDHGAEAQARKGIGIGRTGTEPFDQAREAISEQLRYSQEMAQAARSGAWVNGNDGAGWGNAVMQHAAALQAHDASRATVKQGDVIGQLGDLSKMAPEARAIYLAGKGVDGPTIAGLPQPSQPGQPRFNATNIESANQDPAMAGAASILSSEAPIHQKAAMFAAIPGVENPNSPHRQLWNAFMARQQARGQDFNNELGQYNPQDPEGSKVYDTSNPVSSLGSMFGAARDGLFGGDQATVARNRAFRGHMGKLGYAPASVGIPGSADAVRARIGVKPADY